MKLPFQDRKSAGRTLAEKLSVYRGKKGTIILGLVRGGVVIARSLADALQLPLYPYVVRKIGHPGHREYGVGALAEGGATYIDDIAMKMTGLAFEDIEPVIEEETAELKRRTKAYLVEARPSLKGKTIILTDDGAATGGTMFAAIDDVRNIGATKIIVALPVCPPDTKEELRKRADEAVVLATPKDFNAVGKWYREFPQVEDDEVLRLLQSTAA